MALLHLTYSETMHLLKLLIMFVINQRMYDVGIDFETSIWRKKSGSHSYFLGHKLNTAHDIKLIMAFMNDVIIYTLHILIKKVNRFHKSLTEKCSEVFLSKAWLYCGCKLSLLHNEQSLNIVVPPMTNQNNA